jgi:hypothetical protein
MKNTLLYIIIALLTSSTLFAQETAPEKPYYVKTYLGAGYNHFLTNMKYEGLIKHGFNSTLSIMWQPEHLLSIGLESGYYYIYSYNSGTQLTTFGLTKSSATLAVIPIFVKFSMKMGHGFKLSAGYGSYILDSFAKSFDEEVNSTEISTGLMSAVSYMKPISRNFDFGVELKFNSINKIDDYAIALQIVLGYNLLEY